MPTTPDISADRQTISIDQNEWLPELEKSSMRYHRTILWIAIIFDPLFAITDYINIAEG